MFKLLKKIIMAFVPYGILRLYKQNKYDFRNQIYVPGMSFLEKKRSNFVFENEYIRASALELIADEIYDKNINGSVAELGVFTGDFAKIINQAFPDRKLYLFDTFEGFDKRDVKTELEKGFSSGEQDFSGTCVELVLSKMKNKKNCIVKKGFFPETANGITDTYAFVSIDCDLYEPAYSGLNYFYKNLNHGGYILLHDYNNACYVGIKSALRKFSKENTVPYFPLCDGCGSAVIMKP